MIPDHPQRDYRQLKVLVMGLGSFGGGLGVVRFLLDHGATVTITDSRPAEKLAEVLEELSGVGELRFKLGGHDESDFRQADLIVVNPAVRRDHPCLEAARGAGIPLTSEMNLFWQWNRAPVVAVTGSNGKSTTTALIHSILQHSGRRIWLGGNIGISLLPVVEQIKSDEIVVLELSSFQLADLNRLQVSPRVSVVTNFAPNHLDWHTSLEDYRQAKQVMLRWQTPADVAVLNADDADVREWITSGQRLLFGLHDSGERGVFGCDSKTSVVRASATERFVPIQQWLRLPGSHNLANALAATCAALQMGANLDGVKAGIEQYKPLPHRLQWVADVQGRSFYNDSLATTPESTIVALESFDAPIVLLAGGYDKHVDLSQMAQAIARRAKSVALMGQTARPLRDLIQAASSIAEKELEVQARCVISPDLGSFRQAFEWAVSQSAPGDVILLSPGCASYDWFRNFADRGQQFVDFVRSLEKVDG